MEHVKCVMLGGIAYSLVTISIHLHLYVQSVPLKTSLLAWQNQESRPVVSRTSCVWE